MAGKNEPAVAEGAVTALSGGVPSSSLILRTRADGTGAGTGLESCTEESGCKGGLEGAGAGEFARATGVTVDSDGSIYVRELSNHRVQKFDSAGRFVLMFGGEVDKTTGGTSAPRRRKMSAALALLVRGLGSLVMAIR